MKSKGKNAWKKRCFAILLVLFVLMSVTENSVFFNVAAQEKESGSRIVYFGNYIQRKVTDEKELETLRIMYEDDLFTGGKLYYQGVHYAKKDDDFYKDASIAWRVLKDDGAYLTLLSDKVIDFRAYGSNDGWESSDIRKWLNNTFMENAFTEEEREQIAETTLRSKRLIYMKPSVVEITTDKVYLPQEEDVMNAEYGFSPSDLADRGRIAYKTAYLDPEEQASNWWLRGDPSWAYGNPENVRVSAEGSFVRWYMTWEYGIRPMMRIRKNAAGLSETEPEEKKLNTEYQDSSLDLTQQVAKIFDGESGYGAFQIDGPEVNAAGLEFNLFKFNCEVSSPFEFDHTDFSVKRDKDTNTLQVLVGYKSGVKKELDKASKDSDTWKNKWNSTKSLVLKNRQLETNNDENEKEKAKTLKEKFSTALNEAKEKKAKTMFEAEGKILGYFELQYDDSGKNIVGMNEGGVFVEGSIGVKARQYLFGTIIYVEEGVKGGVEITAGGKWDTERKKIKPYGSFSLLVEPSIALGANAVVADVQGGVHGEIKGTVEFPWKSAKESVTAHLKGDAFVKLSTLIGIKVERTWKFPKYIELWPNLSIQDEVELQMSYEPAKAYGAKQMRDLQTNSKDQIDNNVIDSLAYEHAKPQTVGLSDQRTLLTYLSDSQASADGQNTLMYRIFANGEWSEAKPVCQTPRMDTMGKLFQFDGNTYVIYENSSVPLNESMSSEEVAASMEIYVAEFDAALSAFQTPVKVSAANDTYKHGYLLCEKDGNMTAMWAENSDKDVMQQNGTTKIYESSLKDGAWTDAKEYQWIHEAIQHMGFAKGKLMYSIGNDFWLGDKVYRGTDDVIDSQSFQYANDRIYYTGERGLRYMPQEGGSGQGTEVYTSNTYVLDGERGVYWTETDGFKSNIWYQSFAEGSLPVQITKEDGYIGGFALYQDQGENALVYTFQTVDENAQNPYGATVLKATSALSRTEAKIDSVGYDVLSYQAGAANEFTIEASNSGTEILHHLTAVWSDESGNELARTLLCNELAAGDCIDKTVEITTPAELKQGKLTVTLTADEALESRAVYERSIEGLAPDLSIEYISMKEVKVTNAGEKTASDVEIHIYDGNKTGALLKTFKLGDLDANAFKTVNVSEAYQSAEVDENTRQKTLYCVVLQETEEYTFSDNAVSVYEEVVTVPEDPDKTPGDTDQKTEEDDDDEDEEDKTTEGGNGNGTVQKGQTQITRPGKVTGLKCKRQKKNQIQVKFKKVKDAAGYQAQYAVNKKFKKAKTISVKKTRVILKKLKKGKKYYIRVRAYRQSGGNKVYGSWSKKKSIKMPK